MNIILENLSLLYHAFGCDPVCFLKRATSSTQAAGDGVLFSRKRVNTPMPLCTIIISLKIFRVISYRHKYMIY